METDLPKANSENGKFKIDCEELLLSKLKENLTIIRIPQIWGKNCPRIVQLIHDIKEHLPIET